jgi:hypothetical protein
MVPIMKIVVPTYIALACHAASCRPPGSGGTGGSGTVKALSGKMSRDKMPQIPKAKQNEFDSFLLSHGVTSKLSAVVPGSLTPTQREFNQSKVDAMRENGSYRTKPIKVSADGKIIDGHHSWQAAVQNGDSKIAVIRYSAGIGTMLGLSTRFARDNKIPKKDINDVGLVAACYKSTVPSDATV